MLFTVFMISSPGTCIINTSIKCIFFTCSILLYKQHHISNKHCTFRKLTLPTAQLGYLFPLLTEDLVECRSDRFAIYDLLTLCCSENSPRSSKFGLSPALQYENIHNLFIFFLIYALVKALCLPKSRVTSSRGLGGARSIALYYLDISDTSSGAQTQPDQPLAQHEHGPWLCCVPAASPCQRCHPSGSPTSKLPLAL